MLSKVVIISSIEVTEHSVVQVRTSTRILENGVQLSETYHRHCITPGQDYSIEDPKVQSICASVHTVTEIANYAAFIAASSPNNQVAIV